MSHWNTRKEGKRTFFGC